MSTARIPKKSHNYLRVLFATYHLYEVGGVETDMWLLARNLPAHGIETCFLQMSEQGVLRDRFQRFRKAIVTVPYAAFTTTERCHRGWVKAIRDLNPDVIVLNDAFGWEMVPWLPREIPMVAIFHIFDTGTRLWEIGRTYGNRLSAMVANTEVTAERLITELPKNADKVHVIHCGIDVPPWHDCVKPELHRRVNIVYIGRLTEEQKRISNIVPMVKALKSRLKGRFHLTIAGDGPSRSTLEDALKDDLDRCVTITGPIGPADIAQLQREAHFSVSFSDHEGIPMALREALAAGVVPITTEAQGVPQTFLTDGVNARFFRLDCPDEAAGVVAELASAPEKWKTMSLAARRLGEQRDGTAMGSDYADVLWAASQKGRDLASPLGEPASTELARRASRIRKRIRKQLARTTRAWQLQAKAMTEAASGRRLHGAKTLAKSLATNPPALFTRRSLGCMRRVLLGTQASLDESPVGVHE